MTDEEKKVADKKIEAIEEKKETAKDTSKETAAKDVVEISEEEITGKEKSEVEEEIIDEDKIEEIPYKNLRAGMVVRIHEKIKDITAKGERERIQIFQGIILGVRGGGISRTITARKDSKGWMIEKIFPLSSPKIEKIEIVKRYRVRRAKLTYLKGRFKRKMKELKEIK